jgi:hypothetical protein
MQAVDGFVKLADMGIEGTLNVLVSVDKPTYVQIVCQFSFHEKDLAEWDKEEIINGCIGATLSGEGYHRRSQLSVYRNVVKHVPFLLTAPDGSYSSTWFTSLRMSETYAENAAAIILKFTNLITSSIKGVSLCHLDIDIREFVETFLHDEDTCAEDCICECTWCGLPSWNGDHFECVTS